jgi:hypothetical protein
MDRRRREQINQQAWDNVFPAVREIFLREQEKLLAEEAGQTPQRIDWGARRKSGERNRAFLTYLQNNPDWYELIDEVGLDLLKKFMKKPFGNNRVMLCRHLRLLAQDRPDLLQQLRNYG